MTLLLQPGTRVTALRGPQLAPGALRCARWHSLRRRQPPGRRARLLPARWHAAAQSPPPAEPPPSAATAEPLCRQPWSESAVSGRSRRTDEGTTPASCMMHECSLPCHLQKVLRTSHAREARKHVQQHCYGSSVADCCYQSRCTLCMLRDGLKAVSPITHAAQRLLDLRPRVPSPRSTCGGRS